MNRNALDHIDTPPRRGAAPLASALLVCTLLPGCAAWTNPVANGVPVRLLPNELLAESKEDFIQLPLTTLRQKPPETYDLAAGDTLGVYIEGILGRAEEAPPVNISESAEMAPSIGFPIPVRENGTISLPYVGTIDVDGLTVAQAEAKVIDAYLDKEIVRPEDQRIIVSLLRPRTVRVIVFRDDSAREQLRLQSTSLRGLGTSQTTVGGGRQQGTGLVIELPAYQNDVLTALARSGGLPGLESTEQVIIQRGYWDSANDPTGMQRSWPCEADLDPSSNLGSSRIIRIPFRLRPGQQPPFRPDDVILESGDIIEVRGRVPEFYYTGGLIAANEVSLPNNYDLTVVDAVLKARGPVFNGGVNSNNLNGGIVQPGMGNPSPSLLTVLRRTPNGQQVTIRVNLAQAVRDPRENILVMNQDTLILQETPGEAFARYFTQVTQLDLFLRFINHRDGQGSASAILP